MSNLGSCDRCGHRACVRLRLRSGGELEFCAHHAAAHEERLVCEGAEIEIDTREALYTGV